MKAVIFFIIAWVSTLLVCTWASKPLYKKAVEGEFREKFEALTEEEETKGLQYEFIGYHLVFYGEVGSREAMDSLIEKASEIRGLSILDNTTQKAAADEDSKDMVQKARTGALIFTGALPVEEMQSLVRERAKKAAAKLSYEDTLAESDEVSWDKAICDLIPKFFSQVEEPLLEIDDGLVKLEGILEEQDAFEVLLGEIENLPPSLKVNNKLEVIPWEDPEFLVERKEGNYVVEGLLPDEFVKEELLVTLQEIIGEGKIVSSQINVGARVRPVWWTTHAGTFMAKLFPLTKGDVSLRYTIKGVMVGAIIPDSEILAELEAIAYRLPADKSTWTNFRPEEEEAKESDKE